MTPHGPHSLMSSPSLYEGAFRLETAPSLLSSSSPLLPLPGLTPGSQQDSGNDQEESPLSSPLGDSYKIRIGPKESPSPHSSREDEDRGKLGEENEAQDLSLPHSFLPGHRSGPTSPRGKNSRIYQEEEDIYSRQDKEDIYNRQDKEDIYNRQDNNQDVEQHDEGDNQ